MKRRSVTRLFVGLSVAAAVGVAGSAVAPAAVEAQSGGKKTVKVKTFQFRPADLEVGAGTKIVWKNLDAIEHTVTSDPDSAASFDGVLARKGAKFSTKIEDPGTYAYFCERHPSMKGTITVT